MLPRGGLCLLRTLPRAVGLPTVFTRTAINGQKDTAEPGTALHFCVRLPHSVSYLSDPENKGKRSSGVNFDTIGSWNNRLDLRIDFEESLKRGKLIPKITIESVGTATLIGRRPENEDRLIFKEIKPNLQLFGIFDGHGGKLAAEFVQQRLPFHILYWLEHGESDLGQILKKAFIEVNNSFTNFIVRACLGNSLADQTS